MKRSFLFLVCFTCILSACTKEPAHKNDFNAGGNDLEFTEDELRVLTAYGENNETTIDEVKAIELASRFIAILESDPATRSASPRTIKSIKPMTYSGTGNISAQTNTRSQNGDKITIPEVLAYAINFEDDMGYAIIAADARIPDLVLGISEAGNLPEKGESLENDGLCLFLSMAEDYAVREILKFEQVKDSLINSIYEKVGLQSLIDSYPATRADDTYTVVNTVMTSENILAHISPLVPTEWSQRPPFNDQMPLWPGIATSNGRALAGCVAIAGCHVMAMYKHPTTIAGVTLNWDELNQYSGANWQRDGSYYQWINDMANALDPIRNQAATLTYQVGKAIGMTQKEDGQSGADTKNLVAYLSNNGYRVSSLMFNSGYSFTEERVSNSLRNRRPVLIDGYDTKKESKVLGITVSTKYSGGHTWVIDGLVSGIRYYTTFTETRRISDNSPVSLKASLPQAVPLKLHHHNWGHGGAGNGYYAAGVFNELQGPESPSSRAETTEGQSGNFQYKVSIWPEIRKN